METILTEWSRVPYARFILKHHTSSGAVGGFFAPLITGVDITPIEVSDIRPGSL